MRLTRVPAILALALAACSYKPGPEVKETKTVMNTVNGAIINYKRDTGKYPETLAKLVEKPGPQASEAKKWKGPYLKKVLQDAWARDFEYKVPGTNGASFDLISWGEDGAPGGEKDAQDLALDARSIKPAKK